MTYEDLKEKFANIERYSSYTPSWIKDYFKWLGLRGLDSYLWKRIHEHPRIKELEEEINRVAPLNELEGLSGDERLKKEVERYKRLKPYFEKGRKIEQEVKREIELEIEELFNSNKEIDLLKELLGIYSHISNKDIDEREFMQYVPRILSHYIKKYGEYPL